MYNRTILIGNLTKDPEVRYAPGGAPVATLSIASNTRYKKEGEEPKEETLFIDCIVWGKSGEACGKHLSKGKRVLVEGRLRQRRWEHEGQKRSKYEIVANVVRFLSAKESTGQSGDQVPPDEVADDGPF